MFIYCLNMTLDADWSNNTLLHEFIPCVPYKLYLVLNLKFVVGISLQWCSHDPQCSSGPCVTFFLL